MFLLQTFDVGGGLSNAVERPDHLNSQRIVATPGVVRKDCHPNSSYTSILTPFFNVYLQ